MVLVFLGHDPPVPSPQIDPPPKKKPLQNLFNWVSKGINSIPPPPPPQSPMTILQVSIYPRNGNQVHLSIKCIPPPPKLRGTINPPMINMATPPPPHPSATASLTCAPSRCPIQTIL